MKGTARVPSRVVLGISGSMAAMFAPATVYAVRSLWGAAVRVVATEAALRFVTPESLAIAAASEPITAGSDWAAHGRVAHIELGRWADLVLVAPATADLIGQIATGTARDVLGTLLLATGTATVVAPAMNASMWNKPVVQRNIKLLEQDGYGVAAPVRGPAAADAVVDEGAMRPLPDLLDWTAAWWRKSCTG